MLDSSQKKPQDTQCGPPEGVNIFKWPAAILCWIKAQLPPKISAGKCGPNTIGDNHRKKNTIDASYSKDSEEQNASLQDAQVIPHFERTHLSYFDTAVFEGILENASGQLIPPHGTTAIIQIVQVTDADGNRVDPSQYSEYFELPSHSIPVASDTVQFIIQTKDKAFTLEGHIEYHIPLLNGSTELYASTPFTFQVNESYLDIQLLIQDDEVSTISEET